MLRSLPGWRHGVFGLDGGEEAMSTDRLQHGSRDLRERALDACDLTGMQLPFSSITTSSDFTSCLPGRTSIVGGILGPIFYYCGNRTIYANLRSSKLTRL